MFVLDLKLNDGCVSREKLETFLFRLMESGLILDGVVAQDINQVLSFWRIREVCTSIFHSLFLIICSYKLLFFVFMNHD